ncbi:hypothetical protein EDD37DRAFT_690693 [Exophiala viscosa]|uniref:uncharacterized protein n=1 Tax=Exophiala viscosa TaxID=2486360 RepID=UPI0021997C25|nr:hypothetical protein EDD37DRAFT_690693 [Exophiala viscosa]
MSATTLNPYISNGTCYTAAGDKLGDEFVPCGNDAFGHQTCCGAGDNCLADNACFGVHGSGYGSYLTYWAGCTDPNYEDASCPKKKGDQPWVALTLCDDSDGEWAICSQSGNPSTLQAGAYCSCTNAASATVAFSDSNTLTSVCSLPTSTGQSIQFFVGHFPSSVLTTGSAAASQTSTPTSTGAGGSSSGAANSATATSGPTSTKATATAAATTFVTVFTSSATTFTSTTAPSTTTFTSNGLTFTSTTAPSTTVITSGARTVTSSFVTSTTPSAAAAGGTTGGSSHSGLSSGAKIGIGVGASLGAVMLLALLLALFLRRRKRRRPSQSKMESDGYDHGAVVGAGTEKPPAPRPSEDPPTYDANGQVMQEADGRAAMPWTLRSELEGSQPARKGESVPIAELPGSENYAGQQGGRDSLAVEANRQLGPGWNGPSFKLLNSGGGKEYLQNPS